MRDTEHPTLHAHKLASNGSVVDRPEMDYCDVFDVEADKAAFEAKWKNTATPEELAYDREQSVKAKIRDMRRKGHSWRAIGKKVGLDRETARAMVDEVFAQELKARKGASHKRYAEERKAA